MKTIRVLSLVFATIVVLAFLTYEWGQALESRFRKIAESSHQSLPPGPVAVDYWNTVMRMPSYWLVFAIVVALAVWLGRRWAF